MFLKEVLKDQKLGLKKRPQSFILLWGVIFQMAPNHIAESVWKDQNISSLLPAKQCGDYCLMQMYRDFS